MSARTSASAPARIDAIERSRKYRTPTKPIKHPYEPITPAKRPVLPGVRGLPFELKVNWFRIKFISRPIYIYKVTVETKQRTKDGKGTQFVKITDLATIASAVYKGIHSYRDIFVNPWRFFFDNYDYLFSPDVIATGKDDTTMLRNVVLKERRNSKTIEKYFRIRIKQFVKFELKLSGCSEDSQWSAIFLKLMMSQNARFIPPEIRHDHNQSIHARFAHLDGGMYFIPSTVAHDKETVAKKNIQPGVEAWMGFYMSCRQDEDGNPVINYGKTNKFFVSLNLNVLEFYKGVIKARDRTAVYLTREHVMTDRAIEDFTQRMSGLKVKCSWAPERDYETGYVIGRVERHYRFVKVMKTTESADNYYFYTFDKKRNQRVRVRLDEWYAQQDPPQTLQYPKLPLCEVKTGKKSDFIPMEMLFTHDKPQKFTQQLDPYARMQIAEKLKTSPRDHHKLTTDMVSKKMEYDADPFMNALNSDFKMNLEKEMMECTGRLLNKDGIVKEDNSGQTIPLNAQTGEFPMRRAFETTEKEVIFVGCLASERIHKEDAMTFYKGLVDKCKTRGLKVSQTEIYKKADRSGISKLIEDGIAFLEGRKGKIEEVLVFLFFVDNMDDDLYGEIKMLSDLYHGVVTQVITERTVLKMRSNTVSTEELGDYKTVYHNLWLKINVKLGGVNQIVEFSDPSEPEYGRLPTHEKTMFIGIDVIHPSPNAPIRSFSIAAIVASIDRNAAKYADRIMVNRSCNETVQHFEEHFAPLLYEYKAGRGHLPEKVVVLRDGVSDSEMLMAASRELQSLKATWKRVSNGVPLPEFTYIVVQKRHRTRFYRRDVEVVNANPFPGTVISEGAVSPHMFDFYMISHHTPEGTTRPAHYTTVVNESKFSTDEVTEMCFRLCCLYARCSKPVSIPSPVYYAHLRCKRAAILFRRATRTGELREIDDKGERETDQQYTERVERHAMKIEKLLNRDFTQPKKYPGMHFV